MSLLILASRYLKSGNKHSSGKRKNYTKYIATRETVEIREQKYSLHGDATAAQKDLLKELLDDFPEAKSYLEYQDYEMHPSAENCNELINAVIERNADVIGSKKNLVGYMAMRLGAERRGAHGLFTDSDAPIVLNQVAEEIAHHEGNVWSHVISLRREDAVRLGFDNSESWRQLVKRHLADIAVAQKISLCNLKWYAAFHNTTHHPHIHLLVYSTNPKEGFLTIEGIEKIKSVLANDIFKDELQSIYQEQAVSRDELRKLSADEFQKIMEQIQSGGFDNPELVQLVKKLYVQLQSAKGKKVYGYLPKEIKQTVDAIFAELAKNPRIAALYQKWCDLEKLKYKSYTMKEPDLSPMYQNKVFQPVRNTIIRTVLKMGSIPVPEEPELVPPERFDEPIPEDFIWNENGVVEFEFDSSKVGFQLSWSDAYKKARELFCKKDATDAEKQECLRLFLGEAENGNVLAMYDLGKLYAFKFLGEPDEEKSAEYYQRALIGFFAIEPSVGKMKSYLQYRIGKMYAYSLGTEQDDAEAFEWFKKAAEAGNKFAQYSLAICYYYGKGVTQNDFEAFRWYEKAAQKMPYAAYALGQMYARGEAVTADEVQAKAYYAKALSGFLKMETEGQADENLLYKIGRMYANGLGTEQDMGKAISYFMHSDEMGNLNARRLMGKEYLMGQNVPQDIEKGMGKLIECVESGDMLAAYQLSKFLLNDKAHYDADRAVTLLKTSASKFHWASFLLSRLYLLGAEGIPQDRERAVFWFTRAAEDGNPYAPEWLDNIDKFEQQMVTDTIFGLFVNLSRIIEVEYTHDRKKLQADSKLRRMIRRKKQELGIKENDQNIQ